MLRNGSGQTGSGLGKMTRLGSLGTTELGFEKPMNED